MFFVRTKLSATKCVASEMEGARGTPNRPMIYKENPKESHNC